MCLYSVQILYRYYKKGLAVPGWHWAIALRTLKCKDEFMNRCEFVQTSKPSFIENTNLYRLYYPMIFIYVKEGITMCGACSFGVFDRPPNAERNAERNVS